MPGYFLTNGPKRLWSWSVLLWAAIPCSAQQPPIGWLFDRSWEIRGDDPDSARHYAEVATARARAERDSGNLALGFRRLGLLDQQDGDIDGALRHFHNALGIDSAMGNERAMISTEQKLGSLFSELGRKQEAHAVLRTALERSERLDDDAAVARCCNLLATVCLDLGSLDEAAELVFRGLDIRKHSGDPEGIAASTMQLGTVYVAMNRPTEALRCIRASMAMSWEGKSTTDLADGHLHLGQALRGFGRIDTALVHADSASMLYRAIEDQAGAFRALRLRAGILSDMGEHVKAEEQYRQLLALIGDGGNQLERAEVRFALATDLTAQGRHAEAADLFGQVLRWCRDTDDRFFELSALDGLASSHRALGHLDQALSLFERATALRDSLFNERTGEALASAEVKEKYNVTQREKEIKELKVEIDLREEREQRRVLERNVMILASIGLAAMLVLLVRHLHHRRRLMQQQQQMHEQEVNEMMREQEIHSLESMLQGQQQERGRIAQELHDRLGSMLSVIKMRFSSWEGKGPGTGDRTTVEALTGLIDDAVKEVRRISHDMAHSALADGGLQGALVDLCRTLQVPGTLEVELDLHGMDERMEQSREIAIYRIVQELVGNVLKHADARHLTIEVMRASDLLNIMVTDDGRGFDMRTSAEGLGLSGIRKRVADLGGEVSWDSRPGQGTTAVVELPAGSA